MREPSIRDWLGIRNAAKRKDWPEVERRAGDLGWALVAARARRLAANETEADLRTMVYVLRLDLDDQHYIDAESRDRSGTHASRNTTESGYAEGGELQR